MELSGKVAVVTGSGRGLGLAYARALADAGAAVVINDVDPDAVDAAVKQVLAGGGRAAGEVVAVGTSEAAQALVARAVSEFGRLDIMVTNAGVLRDRVLWKMSDEDFDAVQHVHLRGTFTCARAAAIRMREQGHGGRIIVAGSPAGQRGNFGQTNYAAAKAGIAAMARTWAMELAKSGITANAVIPNAATEMTRTIPLFAPYIEAYENEGAAFPDTLRKGLSFGTPEDCAGLVVFLASDRAQDVTGQCIGIGGDKLSLWSHPQEISVAYTDGGWSAQRIASLWPVSVGQHPESYGIPMPRP